MSVVTIILEVSDSASERFLISALKCRSCFFFCPFFFSSLSLFISSSRAGAEEEKKMLKLEPVFSFCRLVPGHSVHFHVSPSLRYFFRRKNSLLPGVS